jgi:predicted amidohydrolase YtcJ
MKPQTSNFHLPGCICCPALSILTEAFVMPRRMFLLGAGSFAAAIAMGGRAEATPPQPQEVSQRPQTPFADAIYINATVVTVNDKQPTAEAVAVKNGKILAVGDRRTVEALKGSGTQIFDLKGKTLTPGYIDPHGHLFQQGVAAIVADLLPPPDGTVDSIAKLQDKLRSWSQTPISAELGWIIGNGYDDSQLKEQRHPTREELDAVSTDRPILIIHQSGHLGSMNSKGLEIAKITAATKDPAGGVIRRKAGSTEPDGVLEETAMYLGLTAVSKVLKPSPKAALNVASKGAEIYARYGFTTAQEGPGDQRRL